MTDKDNKVAPKRLNINKDLLARRDREIDRANHRMPAYISPCMVRRYCLLYILYTAELAGQRAWAIDIISKMGFAVETAADRNRGYTYLRRLCDTMEADFDICIRLQKAPREEWERGRHSYYEIKSWGFWEAKKVLPMLVRNAEVFESLIKNNIFERDV